MYCSLPASAVESSYINLFENFTEFLSQIFERLLIILFQESEKWW